MKDVLDEMTIPREKTHYALDETYVFEPKLFLKGSALVVGGGAAQVPDPNPALRAGISNTFLWNSEILTLGQQDKT